MDKKVENLARQLRRKMTPAEYFLWGFLRNRQLMNLKFRRQQPIGRFIVDFVCFEKRLVIELDGSLHLENKEKDSIRTTELNKLGYQVIRFTNDEVLNEIDAVIEEIINLSNLINDFHPHPTSPFKGEEKEDLEN